ncbi:MAG TPA: GNAT family N-acetyltransferase, partial [Burkholderiaceae bacterium]|nr:GNAT family N-acetyltransferase [Burkholderiaceae bacterium]
MKDAPDRATTPACARIRIADPLAQASQACLRSYFQELSALFDGGFDPEQSVSANPDELVPPAGWFMLAWVGDKAVGCGGIKLSADLLTAEIKRMWVAPSMRGHGIARQLLHELEARAMESGVRHIRLDTHASLQPARALYARSGYTEIPAYNQNPYAHHWFE